MPTRSPDPCAFCRCRNNGVLCGLGGRARDSLDRRKVTQIYRRGQPIFLAGMLPTALYVVRSGRVKVFRTGRGGEEQVLRLLGPGEIVGFRPLFAHEPYHASATAVETATLCVIPAAMIFELVRDDPKLAPALLAKLARELSTSENLLMDLRYRSVPQRLARLLLQLREDNRAAAEPGLLTSHHLRRQDMAQMIGTRPETLSRALRSLAQRRAIGLTRDQIRILDEDQLARIAGPERA